MSDQPGNAAPGFYPVEGGRMRYWDGGRWTDRYADAETPPPPQGATATQAGSKKRGWFARHKILTGLGALVLLFIVIGIANGGKSSTPTASPVAAPSSAPASSAAPSSAPAFSAPAATSAAPKPARTSTASPPPAPTAGLNSPVRDGKFQFVVSKVDCGKASVGSGGLVKKAQGQFCLVALTVTNVGNESQYLDGSSQKALDAQGRQFSPDTAAAIYLGDQGNTFLNQINPGNAVQGQVVFDIPKDAKISKLELHDSPFSQGVAVAVG